MIRRKHLSTIVIFLLLAPLFACLLTRSSSAADSRRAWDFEDHTYNHAHLTQLNNAQIVSQLEQSSAAFQAHGLPIPEHLAYPYGEFDQRVIDVVSQYRLSGRTAGSGFIHFPETYPVADWYRMSAVNFCTDYSMDHMKGWIDEAIAETGLLHMFTHQVVENPPRYSCSPEMLAQILDYLAAKRDAGLLSVMTIRQAYDSFDGTKAIVVFSFDDGWDSVYTTAWPMFKARSMVGTVYICPWSQNHHSPEKLTWAQVLAMAYPENPPDKPVNPSPPSGATGISTSVTLSAQVTDPDADAMNVSFYQPAVPTPKLIGIAENISSGGVASVLWSGLNYSTSHQWYAIATDPHGLSGQSDVWNFTTARQTYTLTVTSSPAEGGSVTLNNTGPYYYDDKVLLTAVSNLGWSFSSWNGDLSGSINPSVVTMTSNKSVTAIFTQNEYTLTIAASPIGSGSVNLNNTGPYHLGDQVQLTAVPAAGWAFSDWNGDLAGSVNPAVITIDGNKSVTADFVLLEYSLTVTVDPIEAGSVTLNNTGPYHYGYWVRLTAVANSGWLFSHWSGDASGTSGQVDVFIDVDKSVTANFARVEYTLTVSVGGQGSTNATGTHMFAEFTNVTVSAIPNSGWMLDHWALNGTVYAASSLFTVNMTANYDLTAVFTPIQYNLVVSVVGPGVTNSTGTFTFDAFSNVTVLATADSGFHLDHWLLNGSNVGSVNPYKVNMTANYELTAVFLRINHSLTVSVVGHGVTNVTGTQVYDEFTNVSVWAVPDSGSFFDHWLLNDMDAGSVNPYTLNMTNDFELTAVFLAYQRTLTVSVAGNGVTNATGSFSYDLFSNVTVLATPDWGYSLDYWLLNGSLAGSVNPYTLNMTDNFELTPIFAPIEYSLFVGVAGNGVTNVTGVQTYFAFIDVPVLAAADSGYYLVEWLLNGSSVGSANPYVVDMISNYNLTAVFAPIQYSLTVSVWGQGSTNATGTYMHDAFRNVTVLAVPASGWVFDHWILSSTDVGSANPYTINVTTDFVLTAVFTQLQYTLTLNVSPVDSGSVNLNKTGPYHYGDWVRMTAVATSRWTFTQWSGDASGTSSQADIFIDGNKSVTASFTRIQCTLTVSVSGQGSTNATGTFMHDAFSNVTVAAMPSSGYYFDYWILNGTNAGSMNPYTLNMTDNFELTAVFMPIQYDLTVSVSGQGSTNATGTFAHDAFTNVTVLANPASGWVFDHWTLNGTNVGAVNPYTLNMTANYDLAALFTQIRYNYLVARGMDNTIYYRAYNSISMSWNDWNALPSGATPDSPAVAVHSGKLYFVVRGMDGYSLWFSWINLTDYSFSGWTWISGATESEPTLTCYDTQLVLVVRGLDNSIYYRFYDCIADNWGDWVSVPAGATSDAPTAAILNDELHLVVRGLDGYSLWHSWVNLTDNSFSGWTWLTGAIESAPTLTQNGARLVLLVRGLDDGVWYRFYDTFSETWESWQRLSTGFTSDSPAATTMNGELMIVVRGAYDTSLWCCKIDLSTNIASNWEVMSGATPSSPTLSSSVI